MDTSSMLLMLSSKMPKDQAIQMQIREKLEKMSDSERKELSNKLAICGFKNPTTGILLSVFLGGFGVDRFWVGDKLFGFIKLGGFLLYMIVPWLIVYLGISDDSSFEDLMSVAATAGTVGTIIGLVYGIGCFVDIFFASKRTRNYNYKKLQELL